MLTVDYIGIMMAAIKRINRHLFAFKSWKRKKSLHTLKKQQCWCFRTKVYSTSWTINWESPLAIKEKTKTYA